MLDGLDIGHKGVAHDGRLAVEGSSGKQKRAFNRREQHPLTLIFRRPEIEALFNEAHIAQYRRRWLLTTSFGAFIFTIYLVLRLTSHHELYHVTVPTQVAICVMSYALIAMLFSPRTIVWYQVAASIMSHLAIVLNLVQEIYIVDELQELDLIPAFLILTGATMTVRLKFANVLALLAPSVFSVLILILIAHFSWKTNGTLPFFSLFYMVILIVLLLYASYESESSDRSSFFSLYHQAIAHREVLVEHEELKRRLAVHEEGGHAVKESFTLNDVAPVQKILTIIETLTSDTSTPKEIAASLGLVRDILSTKHNIYVPDILSELERADARGLDQETSEYIRGFSHAARTGRRRSQVVSETMDDSDGGGTPGGGGGMLRVDRNTSHSNDSLPRARPDRVKSCDVLTGLAAMKRKDSTSELLARVMDDEIVTDHISGELDKLDEWDFDMVGFAELTNFKPLLFVGMACFEHYEWGTHFSVERFRMREFLVRLEQSYVRSRPYHNSTHGADTLHAMHYFINTCGLSRLTNKLEVLALMVGAAAHDANHTGTNNAFLVATQAELAITYSDRSVLEMHHLRTLFNILVRPDCDIIMALNAEDRRAFRKLVIELVLATDMGNHFEILSVFKTKIMGKELDAEDDECKTLILRMAMKAADVSNPAKSMKTHDVWTDRYVEETYRQGDQERALGLPISPFMDRERPATPKAEVGFFQFIVVPLWENWAAVPSLSLDSLAKQVSMNHYEWKRRLGQEEETRKPAKA